MAKAMRSNSCRPSSLPRFSSGKSGPKASQYKKQRSLSNIERREVDRASGDPWRPTGRDRTSLHEGSSVLDLKGDNYFSCSVARKRSSARYLLKTSQDIVNLLSDLADRSSSPST
jgi:trehalose 6-phosphate synthase/phosphatase